MHQARRATDVAAERLAHALLAEAYAENRQLARELLEDGERDSRFLGRARSRRDDDRIGRSARTPAISISSLRFTVTSAPSSPRYCTRL